MPLICQCVRLGRFWCVDGCRENSVFELGHDLPKVKTNKSLLQTSKERDSAVEKVARLRVELAQARLEADNWRDTAERESRNRDYYRELLERIGRSLGEQAYIADDGSRMQDVLVAKVPELVEELAEKVRAVLKKNPTIEE